MQGPSSTSSRVPWAGRWFAVASSLAAADVRKQRTTTSSRGLRRSLSGRGTCNRSSLKPPLATPANSSGAVCQEEPRPAGIFEEATRVSLDAQVKGSGRRSRPARQGHAGAGNGRRGASTLFWAPRPPRRKRPRRQRRTLFLSRAREWTAEARREAERRLEEQLREAKWISRASESAYLACH